MELDQLRAEIERIDRELVRLIAERTRLARAVGDAKRAAGMRVLDQRQEVTVIRRAAALARQAGLPESEVRGVFSCLIELARRAQR